MDRLIKKQEGGPRIGGHTSVATPCVSMSSTTGGTAWDMLEQFGEQRRVAGEAQASIAALAFH